MPLKFLYLCEAQNVPEWRGYQAGSHITVGSSFRKLPAALNQLSKKKGVTEGEIIPLLYLKVSQHWQPEVFIALRAQCLLVAAAINGAGSAAASISAAFLDAIAFIHSWSETVCTAIPLHTAHSHCGYLTETNEWQEPRLPTSLVADLFIHFR